MKTAALIAIATGAGFAAAQPATIFDFGSVDEASFSGSIQPNEVVWFSVELTGAETYLDIDSNGSAIDTEIGLYDAAGNLVANDDDDGVGTTSVLTFGTGSGLSLGDSFNLGGDGIADGEDGALPGAGTYYIALGEFNVTFNGTAFDVISDGTDTGGEYTITVRTDVPAPATAALLGLGGLVATRRRR